jgi:methenyltetrahydromethanopterin cyclohydrolase
MKKLILFAMMVVIGLTAFSQPKKEVKKVNSDTVITNPNTPTDTLNVNGQKVRYIKINNEVHDLFKEIPLFISLDYAVSAYDFFQHAEYPGKITKDRIDLLQSPLEPWYKYYLQKVKEEQQKK